MRWLKKALLKNRRRHSLSWISIRVRVPARSLFSRPDPSHIDGAARCTAWAQIGYQISADVAVGTEYQEVFHSLLVGRTFSTPIVHGADRVDRSLRPA
jgi:hypothetical protein